MTFPTDTERQQGQAAPQVRRRPNGTFAPGASGNPKRHQQWLEKQRQIKAREAELLQAIIADAGGELSAIDMAFAQQAACQLAKAHFDNRGEIKVRLTRSAAQLVDRVRNGVAARRQRSPVTAFDQYVAEKATR